LFAVAVLAIILAASLFSPVAAFDGGIMITKVTTNGDVTTIFEFSISNDIVLYFDLIGGESQYVPLVSGAYTVKEVVPSGWVLTVTCEGTINVPPVSTFEYIPGEGVIMHYVANDAVTCTFTNSPEQAVGGAVLPANNFAIVAPWLAVIGLVGCIGTVVVAAKKRRP
jgi:hypothetical protein